VNFWQREDALGATFRGQYVRIVGGEFRDVEVTVELLVYDGLFVTR
jgi:hypothetical protein